MPGPGSSFGATEICVEVMKRSEVKLIISIIRSSHHVSIEHEIMRGYDQYLTVVWTSGGCSELLYGRL